MFPLSFFNQFSCERLRPLLARHADGTLTEQERAVVTAHLAACPECRASVESVTRMGNLLRARAPAAPAPRADLWSRVHAEIATDAAPRAARSAPPRPLLLRPVFAVPVAAFAAVSAWAVFGGPVRLHPSVPRPVVVAENRSDTSSAGATVGLPATPRRLDQTTKRSAASPLAALLADKITERPQVAATPPTGAANATTPPAPDPFLPLSARERGNDSARLPQRKVSDRFFVAKTDAENDRSKRNRVRATQEKASRFAMERTEVRDASDVPPNVALNTPKATSLNGGTSVTAAGGDFPSSATSGAPGGSGGGNSDAPMSIASAAVPTPAGSASQDALTPPATTPKSVAAATDAINGSPAYPEMVSGQALRASRNNGSRSRAVIDQNGFRVVESVRQQQAKRSGVAASAPISAEEGEARRPSASAAAPRSAVEMATQIRRQRSLFQYVAP